MIFKIQFGERQEFQCTQPEYGCIGQFSNNNIHFPIKKETLSHLDNGTATRQARNSRQAVSETGYAIYRRPPSFVGQFPHQDTQFSAGDSTLGVGESMKL